METQATTTPWSAGLPVLPVAHCGRFLQAPHLPLQEGLHFPTCQLKNLRHRGAEQFTQKSPANTGLAQLAFLLCPSTIY